MSHKNIFDLSALSPVQTRMFNALNSGDIDEISDGFACNGPAPDYNCPIVMTGFISKADYIIDQLAQDTKNKYKYLAEKNDVLCR